MPRWKDETLAAGIGVVLFLLVAWPVALVDLPPLQDLPNHLATAVVLDHPAEYPDFVSNGLFKTNSALFAWLHFVGHAVGLKLAAKLFVLLTLAVAARAIPFVLLRFGGRGRMITGSLLAWPMIHNWFVCMGMLDFAMGVALGWELLLLLDAQRRAPSLGRGLAAALLACLVWYTHAFALAVVGLLAFVEAVRAASWRERASLARILWLPLVPAAALTVWSAVTQLGEGGPSAEYGWNLRPPWELVYNAWALWLWGFSKWSASSVVCAIALAYFAARSPKSAAPFFSRAALVVLLLLYFFGPYNAANWFSVNARLLPAIWMCALVRVPETLPKRWPALLCAAAAAYSIGMGIDAIKLDREWRRFAEGAKVVPEHARLLPLVFDRKGPGENTWPMLHAWGLYVVEKRTSAPLLFAHSKSFPVSYRQTPPDDQMNQLYLEVFPEGMHDPNALCSVLRTRGIVARDCDALYSELWRDFWQKASALGDYVLTYGATEAALARIPPEYEVVYREGELVIFRARGR